MKNSGMIPAILALALFCGWLAIRARRARRPIVKWTGVILAGLVALLSAFVAIAALIGVIRLVYPVTAPPATLEVTGSPEQVERGKRLAYLCVGCHSSSDELPLDGGPALDVGPIATFYPSNLTPGGPLAEWSDGEIIRAIRDGVNKDGRALLIMPSEQYHTMSDADVQALVAYLRTQPPADRQLPETEVTLLGAMLIGIGVFPLSTRPPTTEPVVAPPPEASPEYGRYLVNISGCRECHGEDLQGGTSDFVPIGPSLPAVVPQWSADEFVETMRTGVDPSGHSMDRELMPWDDFSDAYSEEELAAIYEYIRTLSPPEVTGDQPIDAVVLGTLLNETGDGLFIRQRSPSGPQCGNGCLP